MSVSKAILEALTEEGIAADTVDKTFRDTYLELTGEALNDIQLQAHRKALREYQNAKPGATVPAAKNVHKTKETEMATKTAPKAVKKAPPKTDSKAQKLTKKPPKARPKREKPEPVVLTEDERKKVAAGIVKARRAEGKTGWDNVVRVTETSDAGKPLRVDIRCTVEGCKAIRNIAVQDVFQVKVCSDHQSKASRKYKAELASKRRKGTPAEDLVEEEVEDEEIEEEEVEEEPDEEIEAEIEEEEEAEEEEAEEEEEEVPPPPKRPAKKSPSKAALGKAAKVPRKVG